MFASPVKMPRFYDVAPAAELGRIGIAGGTVVEDFDGDGLLDVVFSSVDFCEPLRLLPQPRRRHLRGPLPRPPVCSSWAA